MESRKFTTPARNEPQSSLPIRPMTIALALALGILSGCRLEGLSRRPSIPITRRKVTNTENPKSQKPPKEDWDHWVREFHEFMNPDEIRQHLSIPPQDRLRQRGTRLMDLKLRKHLLDKIRSKMTKNEIKAFCALPSYKACQDMANAIEKRKG